MISVPGPGNNVFEVSIYRTTFSSNGGWSALGFINDNRLNSFTLSYSPTTGKVLSDINIPGENIFYELRYDTKLGNHILVEKDPHLEDELVCGHNDQLTIESDNSRNKTSRLNPLHDHGPSAIEVLIVYTPQAENWANSNSSGIENIINQSMATAQFIADNSDLDIEFNLAHSQRIEYQETGNSVTDLYRLTASPEFNPWGSEHAGYMDEVHQIRSNSGADLIALFTHTSDVGGIAWVTNNENGLPHYAFSISRIQQASGRTHAHEMGHNFGSAHSRNQNSAPAGNNGGIFTYSTGWRWTGNDGIEYASTMTYLEGAVSAPLFSNPDISHLNVPSGSYEGEFAPADNARSMREMRHIIEEYRSPPTNINPPTVTTSSVSDVSYSVARAGGNVTADGGAEITGRGVCISTEANPDFSDRCENAGSGTGFFESLLTGLDQNTEYHVRAFATNITGSSFGEQQTFNTQRLEEPVAFEATNINAVSFTASWSEIPDAERYFLDLSTDPDFSTFTDEYENRDIGAAQSFSVNNLHPGTTYYYRIRSGAETIQSRNSNIREVSTTDISAANSEILVSRNKVLATGVQQSQIVVSVKNGNSQPVQNAEVTIEPEGGSSVINPSQTVTDASGNGVFTISNQTEEVIRYNVIAAGLNLAENIEIEFVFSDGRLTLGNNFPNPFNNQTIIPIVIPQRSRVRMDLYNSSGVFIQSVLDEEYETGYYEIPVRVSGLASGVYFYRMITEQDIRVEKMLLLK